MNEELISLKQEKDSLVKQLRRSEEQSLLHLRQQLMSETLPLKREQIIRDIKAKIEELQNLIVNLQVQ